MNFSFNAVESRVILTVAGELVVENKSSVTPVTTSEITFVLRLTVKPLITTVASVAVCIGASVLKSKPLIALPAPSSLVSEKSLREPEEPVMTNLKGVAVPSPELINCAVMPVPELLMALTISAGLLLSAKIAISVAGVAPCTDSLRVKSVAERLVAESANPSDTDRCGFAKLCTSI